MSASSAVSVRRGSMTIIDRSGSLAIAFSVVRACGMPWLIHGFLPTNSATSQCSKSPRTGVPSMRPLTQNSPVFSWASALERKRAPNAWSVAVEYVAAEVVPLAAAAVVDDRLAAVGVADRAEAGGDLADRGVPVDLLERAVGPPAQRVQHPLAAAVLVVVEPQRLLARVALRRGMGLVAADPLEVPPVGGRGAPRCRSCTRRGCTPSAAMAAHGRRDLDRVGHLGSLVEKDNADVAKIYCSCHGEGRRLAEHEAGRRRRAGREADAGRPSEQRRQRGDAPRAGPGPCRCTRAGRRRRPGDGGRSGRSRSKRSGSGNSTGSRLAPAIDTTTRSPAPTVAPASVDVTRGVAVDDRRRRLQAQRLLDRRLGAHRIGGDGRPHRRVVEHVPQQVEDHPLGRLDPAEHDDRGVGDRLLRAQPAGGAAAGTDGVPSSAIAAAPVESARRRRRCPTPTPRSPVPADEAARPRPGRGRRSRASRRRSPPPAVPPASVRRSAAAPSVVDEAGPPRGHERPEAARHRPLAELGDVRVAMAAVLGTVGREHARPDDACRREAGIVDGERHRIAQHLDGRRPPGDEPAADGRDPRHRRRRRAAGRGAGAGRSSGRRA